MGVGVSPCILCELDASRSRFPWVVTRTQHDPKTLGTSQSRFTDAARTHGDTATRPCPEKACQVRVVTYGNLDRLAPSVGESMRAPPPPPSSSRRPAVPVARHSMCAARALSSCCGPCCSTCHALYRTACSLFGTCLATSADVVRWCWL